MGRNTCGQEGEMKKSQNKYRVLVRVHVLIHSDIGQMVQYFCVSGEYIM